MKTSTYSKVHRITARLQLLFSCLDSVQLTPRSIPSWDILSTRLILVVP
jgi:hypothetical protein